MFGMTLSFLLNRSFTFRRSETRYGKAKFASVYLSALVVNVSINNLLLTNLVQDNQFSKFVAFFIASGIAMAKSAIGSGAARQKLDAFVAATHLNKYL
jgi:putative flippase GtrA